MTCPFCGHVAANPARLGDHVTKYHREAYEFVEQGAKYHCVCGEAFDHIGPGCSIVDHWNNASGSDGGMHAMLLKLRT